MIYQQFPEVAAAAAARGGGRTLRPDSAIPDRGINYEALTECLH